MKICDEIKGLTEGKVEEVKSPKNAKEVRDMLNRMIETEEDFDTVIDGAVMFAKEAIDANGGGDEKALKKGADMMKKALRIN